MSQFTPTSNTAFDPPSEAEEVVFAALVEWKLGDQPDKPRVVIERWARERARAAIAQEGTEHGAYGPSE